MKLYAVPPDLREIWGMMPGLDEDQILRLRRHKPTGVFGTPAVRTALAAHDVHDLADLAHTLPEELLTVRSVDLRALIKLVTQIACVLHTGPLVPDLDDDDTEHLRGIATRSADLPREVPERLIEIGVDTLDALARTSPTALSDQGITPAQMRACRRAIRAQINRRLMPSPAQAYARRPLPPGLATLPLAHSRLGRTGLGRRLKAEGLSTFAQILPMLPARPATWDGHRPLATLRALQFHIAREARHRIADLAGGDSLYRVPYQGGMPRVLPPLFGDIAICGSAFLSSVPTVQRSPAPRTPAPAWADNLVAYGLETLGDVADADLPYLFEVAQGRKDDVCQMLILVHRTMMEQAQRGSGVAAFETADAGVRAA